MIKRNYHGMTTRQMWVIERVVRGLTNKEIAAELFVTEGAVKWHLTNIYKSLKIKSRAVLILTYVRWDKRKM